MTATNVESSDEVWRDVFGFEGIYQASSLGRVRTLDRYYDDKRWGPKFYKGRIMKPCTGLRGYQYLRFFKDKKPTAMFVHKAVMLAFVGPRPAGYVINHINGIKTDNRPENLEYVTQSQNIRHAFATGLSKHKQRDDKCRFSDEEVRWIRSLPAETGLSFNAISRQIGCAPATIRTICRRISYTWVD